MNCLLWVPRFWPAMGGTELHARHLAHCLTDAGHSVQVVTHCDETHVPLAHGAAVSRTASCLDGKVQIHRLGLDSRINSVDELAARFHHHSRLARPVFCHLLKKRLRGRCRERAAGADVVHFIYNGLTGAGELAADVAEDAGIPFVFTPNVLDTRHRSSAWASRRFVRLYQRASRIIALTAHEARWLADQGVDANRIDVIPYGPILEPQAHPDRFRRQLNIGDKPLVVLLGRLTESKGYKLLLAARETIWQQFPDCQILLIGPPTHSARRYIGAIRDDRVRLVESIDQQAKTDALAACDVFCLPSAFESLGGVYIEAATLGRPSVALDIPVLHHLIESGHNGMLVRHCPAAVAGAIVDLLADEKSRTQMGANARLQALERFDWDTITRQVIQSYNRVAR